MNCVLHILLCTANADLLGKNELDLCQKIHILPFAYLALKDAIVREAFRSGSLTLDGVNRVLRLDPGQNSVIFDFFVRILDVNGSKDAGATYLLNDPANLVSSADYVPTPEFGDDLVKRGPGRKRKL
jgi:hypothetical protein